MGEIFQKAILLPVYPHGEGPQKFLLLPANDNQELQLQSYAQAPDQIDGYCHTKLGRFKRRVSEVRCPNLNPSSS